MYLTHNTDESISPKFTFTVGDCRGKPLDTRGKARALFGSSVDYCSFIFTWWSGMSGGFSIPFAALAFYFSGHARLWYGAFAFLSLLFSSFCLIKRIVELKGKLTPKFQVACSPSITGCRLLATSKTNWVHRVLIRNNGTEPIEACEARITAIAFNGVPIWDGNYALLTFAPSELEDSTSKSLRHEQNNYIDVMFTCRETPTFRMGTVNNMWNYARWMASFSSGRVPSYGRYIHVL